MRESNSTAADYYIRLRSLICSRWLMESVCPQFQTPTCGGGDGGGDNPNKSNSNPNPPCSTTSSSSSDDLPIAISLLKDLTLAAESTIKSVSSFIFNSDELLCVCPYDDRHLMPPESLFRHSLRCSSSPATDLDLDGFLNTLGYTNSLRSYSHLQNQNNCFQHQSASAADLCFSLDDDDEYEYEEPSSRFFYKDCPGVVSLSRLITDEPSPDSDSDSHSHSHSVYVSSSKTFLLPAILSAECANFNFARDLHVDAHAQGQGGGGGAGTKVSQTPAGAREIQIKLLPSEFWALRCEVEAWTDYPTTYSYTVLRVASNLDEVENCGFKRWVISNSPRFGVLIDTAMRDHVSLLVKLCLKVIRTEALCSFKSLVSDEISSISNPKATIFESPKLVSSLLWLASHLSVLYGEANAKLFTIALLREALVSAGFNCMIFKSGQGKSRRDDCVSIDGDCTSGNGCEYSQSISVGSLEFEKNMDASIGGQVLVSQIAAAVAALRERISLEERIKRLRCSQLLPKSQLVNEYLYASARASEIRESRPNFRAILEHEGLLWWRGNSQDSDKAKTKEELLAEERDYKRRRMSYRGKKVKRNTTEVLRDIIEEHMEEIIQAGGVGYNVKDTAGVHAFPTDQNTSGRSANIHEFQRCKYEVSETRLDSSNNEKILHFCSNDGSRIINDLQCPKKENRFKYSKHQEGHERRMHKEEKNSGPRSTSIFRPHAILHDQFTHLGEQGDARAHMSRFQKKVSADNPRYNDYINKSTSKPANNIANQGHKPLSEAKSVYRGRTESFSSKSVTPSAFEDRYDPSASYNECDDG